MDVVQAVKSEICIELHLYLASHLQKVQVHFQAITATNTTVETNSQSPTYVSTTFVPSSCGTAIASIQIKPVLTHHTFTEPGTYSMKHSNLNSCTPPSGKTFTVKQRPKVTITRYLSLSKQEFQQ
jgi:hypothetical protein